MDFDYQVLDETEKIIFALRSLYQSYGYNRYRMGKFEEYDLYSRNKDFLVSDAVITFTDTDGKLMALKPDVTLSIIKNDKDHKGSLRKLCYNESVYRVSKGTNSFKEIMQTGLECIGEVTAENIREVLLLAGKSLSLLSGEYILEISGLEIISLLISGIVKEEAVINRILKLLGERNRHGMLELLRERDIPEKSKEMLLKIPELIGTPDQVIRTLEELIDENHPENEEPVRLEISFLKEVLKDFEDQDVYRHMILDFSLVSDRNYYNGITFKGFISGIPESVLSGGRYDRLMEKMGRRSKAVGFAVYLDLLERLSV